jgi:hypothetical protein
MIPQPVPQPGLRPPLIDSILKDPKVIDVLQENRDGMKILLNDQKFQQTLILSSYWKNLKRDNSTLFDNLSPYYNYYDKNTMLKPSGRLYGVVLNMFGQDKAVDEMIKNDHFMKFVLNDFSQEILKVDEFVRYVNTI